MEWLIALVAAVCLVPRERQRQRVPQERIRVGAIDAALGLELEARSDGPELVVRVVQAAYPELDWTTQTPRQRRLARAVIGHVKRRLADRSFVQDRRLL